MRFLRETILTLVLLGAVPALGETPAQNTVAPDSDQGSPADAQIANPAPSVPAIGNPRPASKLEELITSRLAQFLDWGNRSRRQSKRFTDLVGKWCGLAADPQHGRLSRASRIRRSRPPGLSEARFFP